MSSSTFEVKEPENGSDKLLDLGIDAACEENGIEESTHLDGEVPRDHTYNKEPDVEEEGDEKNSEGEETVKMEETSSPKKKGSKVSKAKKAEKPAGRGRPKKEVVKKEPAAKKGKKKETVSNEAESVVDTTPVNSDEAETKEEAPAIEEKETSRPARRSKKRKVEEKENVIDQSIVEEVQNITEDPALNESTVESPAKKTKVAKEEKSPKPKKTSVPKTQKDDSVEDTANLPKGWVRKLVTRKSGKTAGMVDVYIYSPEGLKFRSKPDVAAYLAKIKSPLKIEDFDFGKRKSNAPTINSTKSLSKTKSKPVKTKEVKKKPQSPKKSAKKLVVAISIARKKKGKSPQKEQKVVKTSKTPVKTVKAKNAKSKGNKKKKTA